MSNTSARNHARCLFVVANGSRGTAYRKRSGESGYDSALDWDEPDARTKDADQGEDRPGRAFPSAGSGARSGMERDGLDDGPKEHAKRNLARRIAEDVSLALRQDAADSFVLIAPPPVAAAVLAHMPGDQRRGLAAEDHHDLTSLPTDALFRRLDDLRTAV
ncbi:host attachment protein [Roseomonas terrae]|uniref:Host attachment protein n=1 Tax=Neoroseomonas terrae TaxID=424799 RepID=A0ABS5EQ58_9PROT|nr:host attachment protein [Neoroseomonas terrae]MBR0653146.1 host attachment protein [Neoroseomonas terrae]